jgi:hypothetical protein
MVWRDSWRPRVWCRRRWTLPPTRTTGDAWPLSVVLLVLLVLLVITSSSTARSSALACLARTMNVSFPWLSFQQPTGQGRAGEGLLSDFCGMLSPCCVLCL